MERTGTDANAVDVSLVHPSRVVVASGEGEAMAVEKNATKDEVMEERIPTSEKLAQALEAAGAPPEMIKAARAFHYDDYKSELAMPTVQLVIDAKAHNLNEIAERAIDGDFDGTKEESDAWAKSPEGRATFAQFRGMLKKKDR